MVRGGDGKQQKVGPPKVRLKEDEGHKEEGNSITGST